MRSGITLRSGAALAAASTVLAALPAAPAHADTPAATPSIVEVFAHQDDDLLFFNPDLRKAYGTPIVSVYVSAGGASGLTGPGEPFPTTCAYALSRDKGARAAHARIAGVTNPTWTVQALSINGKVVEEDTLDQAPQVKLVFMKLHEAGDANFVTGVNNQAQLLDLYENGQADGSHEATMGTLPADGGSSCQAAYAHQTYTHAELTGTLTALIAHYQATAVFGMDPNVGYDFSSNDDHIGVANFTTDALAAYHGPGGTGHVLLRDYRDYTISVDTANVDTGNGSLKNGDFLAYAGPNLSNDPGVDPTGTFYGPMYTREYPRWSNGAKWVALDKSGLLNAFAVIDSQVKVWRENTAGGTWTGPTPVPGGTNIANTVNVVADSNGLLHLFGTRTTDNQIVTDAQTAPGVWGGWTVLGNPNPDDPDTVGNPMPNVGQNGRITVFVRNAGTGVSALTQTASGGWPAVWADLKGTMVRDDLTAATGSSGRAELFAPAIGGMLHWKQNTAGTYVLDSKVLAPQPAGPVGAARNQDGRLQIFYFQPGSVQVTSQWTQTNGTYSAPSASGGPAGLESVAAITGPDGRISQFVRNSGGGVSMNTQTDPNGGFNDAWPDLGNAIIGAPAAAADSAGRIVVLAFEADAGLHIRRQVSSGTGSAYGDWQLVGS